MADKIIIEVNTRIPSFEGLHDINMCSLPPFREPYMIRKTDDRIGTVSIHAYDGSVMGFRDIYNIYLFQTAIPIDTSKVIAVVESNRPDKTGGNAPADDKSEAIANHLIEFFEHEVKHGRLPANLLPLQSGIGNIANAVIGGLAKSRFQNVTV